MSNYEILTSYVHFKNKTEMDEEVTKHRQNNGYKLNKTDNKILTYMMQHAVRYTGVFYQLIETIAKNNGVSVATVKRVLAKLTKLSIVKRIPTFRKRKGGKGATIFQFQFFKNQNEPLQMSHCEQVENTTDSKNEQAISKSKPFISIKKDLKDINTYTQAQSSIGNSKINSFYEKLKTLYKARTGSLENFKSLVSVIYGSIKKIKNDDSIKLPHSYLENLMYLSLDTCLRKQNVKNHAAMLSAIIRNKIQDLITPNPVQSTTTGYQEIVPDWFHNRKKEKTNTTVFEEVNDFELERIEILKKLYGDDWKNKI